MDLIFEWNPWWKKEYNFEGINREKIKDILPWMSRKEIIALIGVRRSGKTTLFYEIIEYLIKKGVNPKGIFFVKADDDRIKTKGLIDAAIDEYRKQVNPRSKFYLFIDEIQEISGWQKTLKRIYDLEKDIKILISGSNASLLKQETSSLLAGRFSYFEVFPFSFREYLKAKGIEVKNRLGIIENKYIIRKLLDEYTKEGSFPEVTLEKREKIKKELIKFYFDSIFYRDIIKRKQIRNPAKMEMLIKYLLQNISNLINFSKIAKAVELTSDSVTEYIKALEDAYLVFYINVFEFSYKKQIISPKKTYCVDSGIRNIVGFSFSEDIGRLYENIVFNSIRRKNEDIYYWRSPQHEEVDFVVKHGAKVKELIQVCFGFKDLETKNREVKSLIKASKELKCNDLTIITEDYEKEESIELLGIKRKIKIIPAWKWLLRS